jgi:transcriptional regulator with XRE-family HTH domain
MSLGDVERQTGINKGAVSKFERGLEGLGRKNIERICGLFGTTSSVLYTVAETVEKNPGLLDDSAKLQFMVKQLTQLIEQYLSASEDTRREIESLLVNADAKKDATS